MNLFSSAGFVTGLIVSLILVVIIFRFANTNHRMETEYDERQKEIRGNGYRFAFYAMAIYECLMMLFTVGEIALPFEPATLHFGAIIAGGLVLACYCIWKGAYFGLNNNVRRYIAVFTALIAFNAIPVIGAWKSGTLMENGRFGPVLVNLMVIVMLLVMAVTIILRKMTDRETE